MRKHGRWLALPLLLALPAAEAGGKPCEALKAEIAAKLEAKGEKAYSLDSLPI